MGRPTDTQANDVGGFLGEGVRKLTVEMRIDSCQFRCLA
jgi:hypothetical protein